MLIPRRITFFGNTALLEARRKEAHALRARFTGCESGLPAASAQHDIVMREPITKNRSDLPPCRANLSTSMRARRP
jgi:peptidyl-prolyl cis-trans isomerase SurA